jgi:hypothetical protein
MSIQYRLESLAEDARNHGPANNHFDYVAVLLPEDALNPRNLPPLPDWHSPEEVRARYARMCVHALEPRCRPDLQAMHNLVEWTEHHWYRPLIESAKEHRERLSEWMSLLNWDDVDVHFIPTADSTQAQIEKDFAQVAPEYPDTDSEDPDHETQIWIFNIRDAQWQTGLLRTT